jgi:hypothetical protein
MKHHDPVNHPSHYVKGGYEVIDVIEAYDLNYLEGNILKYLLRWRQKNGIEDLEKCKWYLSYLIEKEKKRLCQQALNEEKI